MGSNNSSYLDEIKLVVDSNYRNLNKRIKSIENKLYCIEEQNVEPPERKAGSMQESDQSLSKNFKDLNTKVNRLLINTRKMCNYPIKRPEILAEN